MELTTDNSQKLLLIKLVHTLIWAFYVLVIGYILYAGIFDDVNLLAWVAIGLVIVEGVILMFNEGRCPLTPIAARYTKKMDDSFDIFLPNWLARNNKIIFGSIASVGAAMIIYRALM